MYLNKVILFGNLTKDPELKQIGEKTSACNMVIATNVTFTDKEQKRVEKSEYHNVVAYGERANIITKHLKKGSFLYVEGKLQTRSWGPDEDKKYKTEIVVDEFQFGPKRMVGQEII